MNEEVLHTHTTVFYIYSTWRDYREYSPWIYESDTDPRSLVTQKTPTGTSSVLLFLLFFFFFLASFSCRLSRRRRRTGGRLLPEDIKATTKRVEKTAATLRVCLERIGRLCSSEASVEANSDRLSSPVQHRNGQQTATIREDTRSIHV